MIRHVPVRGVTRALTGAVLGLALFGMAALSPISASAQAQQRTASLDSQPAPVASRSAGATLDVGASGPVLPIPSTLWKPAAGAVPATGDYVYLKSDAGDYIGQGGTYLYTRANAALSVSASGGLLSVGVDGDEYWTGRFATMTSITDLEQGYYPNLERYPFNDSSVGGLDWYGEGRGSNTLTGWFAIDSVTYDNGALSAITLRFELHSEGGTPALHGAIHWEADDTTQPPGPVLPIPGTLWKPAAGVVPASGDYVYLESDPGDDIGAGRAYLYTPATAELDVSASGRRLTVWVNGDTYWEGFFTTMSSLTDLAPGYYPGVKSDPHNPAKGGIDWSGDGRADDETGWFAIDSVTYANGALTAIDLRFTQHTGAGKPFLHGVIHWDAAATQPPTATTLTLTAPSVCAYGSAKLSGTLKDVSSQPLAGEPVTIRCTTGGAWTTVGHVTTDASGAFRCSAAPSTAVVYQAVCPGDVTYSGVTSTPRATLPKVYLTKPTAPKSTRTTTTFTTACYLKPHHAAGKYAVVFQFQRRVSAHWVTKAALKVRAANYRGYSKCSVKVRLLVKGSWRVRAVHIADSNNATTMTAWRAVKVT
jgi:hypothetical protein